MNPNIPSIEQLKELALPAPVSYAPQTWGWWLLLGLLVTTALLIAVRHYRQWRRDGYRREALIRLTELQKRSDDLSALRELPILLKRVALSMPHSHKAGLVAAGLPAKAPGRSTPMLNPKSSSRASPFPQGPAALGGQSWQVFLQKHSPQSLPENFSQQLAQLAYAPDATLQTIPSEQRQQLFATCKNWVEQHHVAA